jgi:thiosulfate reductase cytochrome b subunit
MTAPERIERDSDMHRLYIHPLPVRIWHWINAVGFVLMILTGLQIRYVGLIDVVSFRTAVTMHNWVGFVLIANFFVWLLFYLFSDRIRVYHPESPRKHFLGAFRQAYYYGYGIFKGDPNPFHVSIYRKFNPLQSMTYQVILMLLVPIQFYTGILMWDVKRFSAQVDFFGGVRVIDTVHVLIFIAIVFYLFVHVYLSTLGKTRTAHFTEMLTGYEDIEEEPTVTEAEPAPPSGARPV